MEVIESTGAADMGEGNPCRRTRVRLCFVEEVTFKLHLRGVRIGFYGSLREMFLAKGTT